MIDLIQRSDQKELMDADDIPFADMAETLKELNTINTWLGGHAITLNGIKQFTQQDKSIRVCEIGCGGGDNLFAIYKYCSKRNIKVHFIGIDINPECITFARQQYPQLPCQWICSDYAKVNFDERPDIIFSSLFCHHFADEELVSMLQWQQKESKKGFFINDLHRHWLAWFLIKNITKFFSKSYLVKNDAAVSVARGFRKKEWQHLFNQAGIQNYKISWQWAFRFLVSCKNEC